MALTKSVAEIVEQDTSGLLGAHRSWQRIALREVAQVLNGFPFDSAGFNADQGMPLVRIRDVVSGSTSTQFDGQFDRAYLLSDGDLLVGMDGDFNCARWRGGPALLNQRVCKISVDRNLYEPRLLDGLLPVYLAAINAETSSVTVKHLSSRTIEEIWLPLPPRGEQGRLADKLEELLGDLDSAAGELKSAKRKLAVYRQSLLKFAVEGKLTAEWRGEPAKVDTDTPATSPEGWPAIPNCWQWSTAESECGFITKGTTPPKSLTSDGAKCVPFLRVTNLTHDGSLNFSDQVFVAEDVHRKFLARSIVKPGDVLMNIVGPPLGQVSMVPSTFPEWNVNQAIAIFRVQPSLLNEFLAYVLLSPSAGRWLQARAKTTAGQTNLTLEVCRSLPVPVPPLAEQAEIVMLLSQQLEALTEQGKAIDRAIAMASAQRQNILRAAFSGQLVPQDPNDEPASVLLDRIRAQHSAASDRPAARRPRKAKIAA